MPDLLLLLPMAMMIIAPVVRGNTRNRVEAVAAATSADGDVARNLPSLPSCRVQVHGMQCNGMEGTQYYPRGKVVGLIGLVRPGVFFVLYVCDFEMEDGPARHAMYVLLWKGE